MKRTTLQTALFLASAPNAYAQSSATDTLLHGLVDVYLLLKTILILLSVFSIIAIAVYAYRGQFPWGWLTSLAFSAALLSLAPYILQYTTSHNPIGITSTPQTPQSNLHGPQTATLLPGQSNAQDEPPTYHGRLNAAVREWCFHNIATDHVHLTSCTELPWYHDTGRRHITLPSNVFTSICAAIGVCDHPPRIPFQG